MGKYLIDEVMMGIYLNFSIIENIMNLCLSSTSLAVQIYVMGLDIRMRDYVYK